MPPGGDEGGPSRSSAAPVARAARPTTTAAASRGNQGGGPAEATRKRARQPHASHPRVIEPLEESVDGDIAQKIFGDGSSSAMQQSLRLSIRTTATHTKAGFESVDQATLRGSIATALNGLLGGERNRFVGSSFRLKKRGSRPNAVGKVETFHYGVGVPCTPEEASLLSALIQAAGGLAIDMGGGQEGTAMLFTGDDPADAHYILHLSGDSWGPLADSPQAAEGLFDFLKARGGPSMGVQWVAKVQPAEDGCGWTVLSSFSKDGCPSPTLSAIPSRHIRASAHAVHFLALVAGGHEFTCKAQQAGGINLSNKTPRGPTPSGSSPRPIRIQVARLFPTLRPRSGAEQPSPPSSSAPLGSFAAVVATGKSSSSAPPDPISRIHAEKESSPAAVPTATAATSAGLSDLADAASAPASMDERLSTGSEKRGRSPSPPAAKEEAVKAAAESAAKAGEKVAADEEKVAEATRLAEKKPLAQVEKLAPHAARKEEKEKERKERDRRNNAERPRQNAGVSKPMTRGRGRTSLGSIAEEELGEMAEAAAGNMVVQGCEGEPTVGAVEVAGTGWPTSGHDGPQ